MGRSAGLGAWLATLSAAELEALLRARPDVLRHPAPEDLATLANRLAAPASVTRAQLQLDRPAIQIVEALGAVGGAASRDDLLRLLGATDDARAARVDAVLADLRSRALAWPVRDRVRLLSGGSGIARDPLGLGRSARELYRLLSPAQLSRIGSGLGLGGLGHHDDAWVDVIAAAVADPGTVEERLAHAGPGVAEAVRRLAWHGPRTSGVEFPEPDESVGPAQLGRRLAVQGWVVPIEWGIGEMPREVALAVRGPEYHAPFDAYPPPLATAPVEPEQVRKAGEHAALAACESVRRLVSLLDRAPLATVQSGGVGVRELRRAAKELSADVDAVRLWLETSAAAGLVALARDTEKATTLRRGYSPPVGVALATAAVDEWSATDPAEALGRLLLAWWELPLVPSLRVDESGRPAPALVRAFGHPEHLRLRAGALRALAGLDAGRGITEPGTLREHLAYHAPVEFVPADILHQLRATLAEAELLGLVSAGALTPIGHHLLGAVRTADPPTALRDALTGVLPPPSRTATFLPDLTALVAGTAAPALARLLDTTAEPESRDTASIWRFTADSVRRALDGGHSPDALLAELTAAADNPLPQPLEYLVRDVARRHGEVQVLAVTTCIRVADAALGAELAAHRALAPLRLRPLADTVLAAELPVEETLAALRSAGYAPLQRHTSGAMVVERSPVRRAAGPARATPYHPGAPLDVAALAARLSGGG